MSRHPGSPLNPSDPGCVGLGAFGVSAVVLLTLAANCAWAQEQPTPVPKPKNPPNNRRVIGEPAPLFRGAVVNRAACGIDKVILADMIGPKASAPRPLVLSFGASWCEPCLAELKELAIRAQELTDRGVSVVVVVVDETKAGQDKLVRYLTAELKMPFPVVLDDFQIVQRRYDAMRLPTTVVLDRKGRFAWSNEAYEPDRSFASLLDAVSKLNKGSDGSSIATPHED